MAYGQKLGGAGWKPVAWDQYGNPGYRHQSGHISYLDSNGVSYYCDNQGPFFYNQNGQAVDYRPLGRRTITRPTTDIPSVMQPSPPGPAPVQESLPVSVKNEPTQDYRYLALMEKFGDFEKSLPIDSILPALISGLCSQ